MRILMGICEGKSAARFIPEPDEPGYSPDERYAMTALRGGGFCPRCEKYVGDMVKIDSGGEQICWCACGAVFHNRDGVSRILADLSKGD